MKKRQWWKPFLAVPVALALAGCGASSASSSAKSTTPTHHYVLKVATWGSPSTPQVADFVPAFTKMVEKNSHGAITVQSFPAGALLGEQAMPTGIPSDVADVGLISVGTWTSTVPLAGITDTLFFSPSFSKFNVVAGPGTPLFNALDKAYQKDGVKLLILLDNGPSIFVSHVPMTTPSAFHGKTVRVYDLLSGQLAKALGAAPSTLSVSSVYTALQRGTVEAAYGGLEGAIGLKEYEVAKYLLDPNGAFGTGVNGYAMNLHTYDALPKSLQKVVVQAAQTVGLKTEAAVDKAYVQQLATMKQKGMTVTILKPGTSSYKAFQAAVASLSNSQKAQYPHALVQDILNAER